MLGTIAVFVTLVYVAIQVRLARDGQALGQPPSRVNAFAKTSWLTLTNERLIAIRLEGETALGGMLTQNPFNEALISRGLTLEGSMTLFNDELALYNARYPTVYYLDQLQRGERLAFDRDIRLYYGRPPGVGRTWYEAVKTLLNSDAVAYFDEVLARPS